VRAAPLPASLAQSAVRAPGEIIPSTQVKMMARGHTFSPPSIPPVAAGRAAARLDAAPILDDFDVPFARRRSPARVLLTLLVLVAIVAAAILFGPRILQR
jgi:hypothetical protein